MFSDKWHKRFMEVAELVSTWSKDPSTKVGAIVVGPDREIRSTGYNGLVRGVDDNKPNVWNAPPNMTSSSMPNAMPFTMPALSAHR